ncbi:MAG: T9SS type A sorting domain-containing protein [Ignavibacteriales bacterium]|nr:T9SS type A sorting domain-containing protein [Ignavibacteriales bacterium]
MSDKYFIILLHDPFIRQGYQNGIVVNWMGELLDSLNSTFGDRIKYKTLSEAAKAFRDAGTSIADGSENFNMQLKLKQNFPNPFNPSTIISFQTPKEGSALLKVYDMLGNEIVTLLNGPVSSGEHSVRFDANGMASGVYFYRLTINGSTLSGKMLLGK